MGYFLPSRCDIVNGASKNFFKKYVAIFQHDKKQERRNPSFLRSCMVRSHPQVRAFALAGALFCPCCNQLK
jgi:hypothetical protein